MGTLKNILIPAEGNEKGGFPEPGTTACFVYCWIACVAASLQSFSSCFFDRVSISSDSCRLFRFSVLVLFIVSVLFLFAGDDRGASRSSS